LLLEEAEVVGVGGCEDVPGIPSYEARLLESGNIQRCSMRQPLKLKPIRGRQLNRLREMYDQADCPRLRRRVQIVLLAQAGYDTPQIAQITRQGPVTVRRWLHRFETEGCTGLLEAPRSGRPLAITTAVEAFLREAVMKSPRAYGYRRPGWTTALLAKLVRRRFKRSVTGECSRQHLAQVDAVCRRPTWTVKYRAQEQPGYAQKKAGLLDV
jgi:transposase